MVESTRPKQLPHGLPGLKNGEVMGGPSIISRPDSSDGARKFPDKGDIFTPQKIEVRLADLATDAEAIVNMLKQPSTMPHLGGIHPAYTADNLREHYDRYPTQHPLVATSPEGEIVGTVTVREPNFGARQAEIMKIAVKEEGRRKGVGMALLNSAHSLAFCPEEEGGFDALYVSAWVVVNLRGSEKAPLNLFREKMHYRKQGETWKRRGTTWSTRAKDFVERDVDELVLDRQRWVRHLPKAKTEAFPKNPPPPPVSEPN